MFKVGDKVVMKDNELHKHMPDCYPNANTIGIILGLHGYNVAVQWAKGSTSEDDCWLVSTERIKLYKREGD